MSAPKIKNLVILILILLNVFLLALVVPTRLADRQRLRQADESLVQLYADADVSLRVEDIPQTKTLYPADLPMTEEGILPAIRAILGQELLTRQTDDGTHFSSAAGTAVLQPDGTLTATVTDHETHDPEAHTRELLTAMGVSWSDVRLQTKDAGVTVCTAVLQSSDIPIVTHSLRFRYENGSLKSVTGLLLPAQAAAETAATQGITARDALIAFLGSRISTGWVGERIESVRQGYCLTTDTAQSLWHLQPTWYISTDAGDYLVDGLTRAVSPVS